VIQGRKTKPNKIKLNLENFKKLNCHKNFVVAVLVIIVEW